MKSITTMTSYVLLHLTFPALLLAQANLENPPDGSVQNGIIVFSGWTCSGTTVEIDVDGAVFTAGYPTTRDDTAATCDNDGNNGLGLLFNANHFGDGEHTARLLVDGVEVDQSTFTVVTFDGQEFLTGANGQCTAFSFPEAGNNITLGWQESTQSFTVQNVNNDELGSSPCTAVSQSAHFACLNDVEDDYWETRGICEDIADTTARQDCRDEAALDRSDALEECNGILDARNEVCDLVGHEAYDPDFNPANFVDPDDIGRSVIPNPYWPLVVGNTWVYEDEGETITVIVTDKVKLIDGVKCRVVNDIVREDGAIIEDTDDWYAQHTNGDIWYCGELSRNFESFDGDDPEEPELVDIDGSFKAGREGNRPGLLIEANPQVGDAYRQEMALAEAEDVAEVISITASESAPGGSCSGNCLVTREFTALEPGVTEHKYYAPGIGQILETEDDTRVELQSFTPGS